MKASASVLTLVALFALSAPQGASAKACGKVTVKSASGSTLGGPVRASRMTCAKARSVIRYALKHPSGNSYVGPKGWECARGAATSNFSFECRRGRARAWMPPEATKRG
jgi:hypothetical protein